MSDEKSQQQTSTESTVAGAAKAGKAISNIAKGAAAGGAHGAAIEAGKSSAKWLIPLIAAVLLPLILVAMLPSIIFGSLLGDGTDSPNGISNDEVLISENSILAKKIQQLHIFFSLLIPDKVTFKTNLNDYRTLASNLLTSNNYSLSLNAATLRLAQGEYVTDVRFEFGTVPSGFSSVVKPTMRVQVLGTVSNGYQIINRADVGGQYLNEWQTAKTTWVTTVRRFNTTPLPKTGY